MIEAAEPQALVVQQTKKLAFVVIKFVQEVTLGAFGLLYFLHTIFNSVTGLLKPTFLHFNSPKCRLTTPTSTATSTIMARIIAAGTSRVSARLVMTAPAAQSARAAIQVRRLRDSARHVC